MRGGRGAGRVAWTTAGVVSLAAHIALLGLAIWLLGRSPPPVETPSLSVQLITLAPRRPSRSEPRAEDPAAPGRSRPAPRPAVDIPPDATPLHLPAAPAEPSAGVSRALRGRLGCPPGDPSRLTAEERERCRAALAEAGAARDGPSPRLDLSRQGRIAKDPDFDLSRRPKNGCKLRAAGSRDPMGKEGAAAGVSCGWSF